MEKLLIIGGAGLLIWYFLVPAAEDTSTGLPAVAAPGAITPIGTPRGGVKPLLSPAIAMGTTTLTEPLPVQPDPSGGTVTYPYNVPVRPGALNPANNPFEPGDDDPIIWGPHGSNPYTYNY